MAAVAAAVLGGRSGRSGVAYKALRKTLVRAGFEMGSKPLAKLDAGAEIVSLDERVTGKGVTRVRFARGWVSMAGFGRCEWGLLG